MAVKPSAIYVWLVPSEEVLEQPGSWRIRKWDTEPFPEANFSLAPSESGERSPLLERAEKAERRMLWLLQHVSADELTRVLKKPVQTIGEALDEIERMTHG